MSVLSWRATILPSIIFFDFSNLHCRIKRETRSPKSQRAKWKRLRNRGLAIFRRALQLLLNQRKSTNWKVFIWLHHSWFLLIYQERRRLVFEGLSNNFFRRWKWKVETPTLTGAFLPHFLDSNFIKTCQSFLFRDSWMPLLGRNRSIMRSLVSKAKRHQAHASHHGLKSHFHVSN